MGVSAGVVAAIVAASLVATYLTFRAYKKLIKQTKGWQALRLQHKGVAQFLLMHRELRSTKASAGDGATEEARVPLNILGGIGSPETRAAVRLGGSPSQSLPGPAESTTIDADSGMMLEIQLAKTVNDLSSIEVVDLDYRDPPQDAAGNSTQEQSPKSFESTNWTSRLFGVNV